ncbi:MAG: hypothetical protein AMXMBFR59_42180 [Rhodanobacteraceae bacterium]
MLFSGIASSTSAAALSVCSVPSSVTVGDTATVDVCISEIVDGAAPSLGVFDVEFGFDPALLAFIGATYGDPVLGNQLDLFNLGSIQITTPGAATIGLFELSLDLADDLDNLQAASFVLARLTFDTLAAGSSALTLAVNALGDSLGNALEGVSIVGANLLVSAPPSNEVSEPATLLLVPVALWLVSATRRRARTAHLRAP